MRVKSNGILLIYSIRSTIMRTAKNSVICLLLVAMAIGSAARAESVSVLLQEGLYAEEIEGDLDATIKIYEQIVAAPGVAQRIAALAAYRIGMCYLKMGEESKAIEQFGGIVSGFPEQTAVAGRAREQLVKLGTIEESGRADVVLAAGHPVKGGGSSIGEVAPPGLQDSLVFYYSFYADRDPETAIDISGRGNHGEVHGATYTTDSVLGGAMLFDGGDDYVKLPDVSLGAFSFSAWVTTSADDMNNRRIFVLDGGGDNYYALQGNGGGGIGLYVTEDIEINEYEWQFTTGKWTHITVTHDGEAINIYINGKLVETGAGDFSETITGNAYIGFSGYFEGDERHDGDYCWQGKIDEAALFNRGLTAEEVGNLFDMTGQADETGEQFRGSLYERLPMEVMQFVAGKYGAISAAAGAKELYSNSHIYFVTADLVLMKGGMGYYYNWTGQVQSGRIRLSGTTVVEQKLYDAAGREMDIKIEPDQVRTGFHHVYWTPSEPIPPGQMFYYGWSDNRSKKLGSTAEPGQYSMTMQNKFGDRAVETFFLVLRKGTTITGKSEDFSGKDTVGDFDVYHWSKEMPPNTNNVVNVTLLVEGGFGRTADPGAAANMLPALKGLMRGIFEAIDNKDTDTAVVLLDKLIADSKKLARSVKGTSTEGGVASGIGTLEMLREALANKQMDRAKSLLSALNQMGPGLEDAVEKEAAKSRRDMTEAEEQPDTDR